MKMNKKQVISLFRKLYPNDKFYTMDGNRYTLDESMRNEAWNNFTDSLCKDGHITLKQYNSWISPWT